MSEFDTRGVMRKDAQARDDSLETMSEVIKIMMKSWTQSLLGMMVQIQEKCAVLQDMRLLQFHLGGEQDEKQEMITRIWAERWGE